MSRGFIDGHITLADCREAGYCGRGVREKFDLLGLDFRRLVKEGIPVEELRHIDDAQVQRLVEMIDGRGPYGR